MKKLGRNFSAIAAITMMAAASGTAYPAVLIDITQSGGNVDVTATGSLDLTGATFFTNEGYSTGIIPGGSNFFLALGTTPGVNYFALTSTSAPFGTSTTFFSSSSTSGDAFAIAASVGLPLVGVAAAYTSGNPISAHMVFAGETIAGLTLIPGTYSFTIPSDTITVEIAGGVPEPSTWAMMLLGFAGLGFVGYRRARRLVASAA